MTSKEICGWAQIAELCAQRKPANRQANEDSTQPNNKETERCLRQRKGTGHECGHRESVSDERAGIVDQAFALQNCYDPARNVQPLRDAGRRNRVRRRNMRPVMARS